MAGVVMNVYGTGLFGNEEKYGTLVRLLGWLCSGLRGVLARWAVRLGGWPACWLGG